MKRHQWSDIPREQLNPDCARQVIHTDRITIARLYLRAGAVVARHSHENEQVTVLQTGRLKFIFDDREEIVEAGQCLQIPSYAPHRVEALEDSEAMDLFAPIREDWIRGDDAYLRGGATSS
jgi:quercetin dioxygenase-like cupin family protein